MDDDKRVWLRRFLVWEAVIVSAFGLAACLLPWPAGWAAIGLGAASSVGNLAGWASMHFE